MPILPAGWLFGLPIGASSPLYVVLSCVVLPFMPHLQRYSTSLPCDLLELINVSVIYKFLI